MYKGARTNIKVSTPAFFLKQTSTLANGKRSFGQKTCKRLLFWKLRTLQTFLALLPKDKINNPSQI
jgi:hypothetical protein